MLGVGVFKLTIGSHAQTMFIIGKNQLARFWVRATIRCDYHRSVRKCRTYF